MVDSLSYWAFTDIFEELGEGPEAFHGGYGLLNMHGIKKLAYYAYQWMNELGKQVLARADEGIVTRNSDGKIQALFYNYDKNMEHAVPIVEYPAYEVASAMAKTGTKKEVRFVLENIPENSTWEIERLRVENTTTWLWEQWGCPENLTKEQEQLLREQVPETSFMDVAQKEKLMVSLELEPWEIVFIHQE